MLKVMYNNKHSENADSSIFSNFSLISLRIVSCTIWLNIKMFYWIIWHNFANISSKITNFKSVWASAFGNNLAKTEWNSMHRYGVSLKRLEGPSKASLEYMHNTVRDCTKGQGHRLRSNNSGSAERFLLPKLW